MLKKFLFVLLVLVVALAVVACGDTVETEGGNETDAPATDAPATDAPETDGETEHQHDLEVEDVPATCQARGYHKETCKTCGEVVAEATYPKTECTPAAAATCTADSVCSVCGDVVEAATGHSFGEAVVVAATCKAEGSSTKTCATCGESEVTALAIVAHNIPDENVTASVESTACGVPGSKTGTCTICNESVTVELPGLAHTFTLGEAVVAADGTITAPCTACGKTVAATLDTVFALTFDDESVAAEVDKINNEHVRVINKNDDSKGLCAQIKENGDRSVLYFKWANPLFIDYDLELFEGASYFAITFDYMVGKEVGTGPQVSVIAAVPGMSNGSQGSKGCPFANAVKYNRETGKFTNGQTTEYMDVTAGEWYQFTIIVDNNAASGMGTAYIYINGQLIRTLNNWGATQTVLDKYGCLSFRIGEMGNTHDPLYDNFSISVVR